MKKKKMVKKNNTLKGIGNDIIEIQRIRKTIKRFGHHFYEKIFTKKELVYCLKHKDPSITLAGRFSAKEAIAKALGTGFGESVSWLDIEILNDETGRPIVSFSPELNRLFDSPSVLVSISHCKSFATSNAIWVG